MRRLLASGLLALALTAGRSAPVKAWGFAPHKFITDHAIGLLPPELRPFFEKFRVTVVEHAIDPDTYRTMGWTLEPPRHFVDLDAYGPYPFADLPHDYHEAVAKRGADFVIKNGTLPWRTTEMYDQLRDNFRKLGTAPYARDNIKLFSSVVSHYIADAHQPFHAAVNYDGQLTGQNGIHSRFETELFERFESRLHLEPGPIVAVPDVREFTFAALADSFQLVAPILAADKEAIGDRGEYDDAYFEGLLKRTQPILERRLSQAISGVASVITAAWVEAGKPPLPVDAPPRPPAKVRRDGR